MTTRHILTALLCAGIPALLCVPFAALDRWQQRRRQVATVLRALEIERLTALKLRARATQTGDPK